MTKMPNFVGGAALASLEKTRSNLKWNGFESCLRLTVVEGLPILPGQSDSQLKRALA